MNPSTDANHCVAASSHPSFMSSVAVTPMAQTRLMKAPSINSNYANVENNTLRHNAKHHLKFLWYTITYISAHRKKIIK